MIDLKNWYDGHLYAKFLDPSEKTLRSMVVERIAPETTVLDAACGTGSLVFELAERCGQVTGIDLSAKMIRYAELQKEKDRIQNARFVQGDLAGMSEPEQPGFDYVTAVLLFHEIPSPMRPVIMSRLKKQGRTLILADFRAPLPLNVDGLFNRIIEMSGGREHYRMLRSFLREGGLPGLVQMCGLTIRGAACDRTGNFIVLEVR
ncbi:class I SAM-dependent methyltransferase [bacterium]|nr:class I SAM-dependent methyltransferase [bacterium]